MPINTFELQNGMRVVLEEDHSSKVISFNALVNVGSANETEDEAGLCHVIEHMLFKGTPKRPAGTIARDVEAAGGDINAYTSLDQTVFYINMASHFKDKGLEILSDAIKNPLFDALELTREAEVIIEEMRREFDNPGRMVGEYLFRSAYKVHTYGRPIIGYEKTVKGFTREKLFDFFHKWYTPKNIVFIAVGDFETKNMLADIERAFSDFDGPPIPQLNIPAEPKQSKPRINFKTMNVQSMYLALGFHIPEITHEDVPAVDILAHILGGTDSSRLEQVVKEKKHLAHSVYASSYTPKHPGLFYVGAVLSDADAKKAIAAIGEEVCKLQMEPVTTEELSRAKVAIRSNQIYEKETVGGQSAKIASFIASAGSLEFEKQYYRTLSEVSIADVMKVAQKYLNANTLTLAVIAPQNSKWSGSSKSLLAEFSSSRKSKAISKIKKSEGPTVIKLKNGVRLIVKENHKLPIVSICAASVSGLRAENKKNNGITNLMARLITKGTKHMTAVEIASEMEKLAGHIDGFAGKNAFGLRSEFLSEHLHYGFEIFADVLCNPSFEPAEVAKEKALVQMAIKDQEDMLSAFSYMKFLELLYPKHPYGLRPLGTHESVKSLTRAKLMACHLAAIKSEGLVLSVVGDVSTDEVKVLAEEYLSALPKGKVKRSIIKKDPIATKPKIASVEKEEKQQAHVVIGFQGTQFTSADRFAMGVLNNILSGQGGRLFRELRDKLSLAYSVNSINQEGIDPGYFAVYIGTEPGKLDLAVNEILKELRNICSEKVTEEELERAKQYLIGSYELERQKNDAMVSIYTFHKLYGIGLDEVDEYPKHIMKVTANDILDAARKYIKPDAYTMAVVRPSEK